MNRRHRAAQLAGRASVQLHTLIFFAVDEAREEDAYVLDIDTAEKSEPSISVMVPRYGIEGRVKIPVSYDDPELVRLPNEHRITYRRNISVQVFDRIRVKLWVREVHDYQRELVIELVTPLFEPTESKKRSAENPPEISPTKMPKKKVGK
jgi:exosome complex exonuclease DIS3/RRP44